MRLICPNCDAQYEVADDAIPPGGRDVQCSNCQVSWFQTEKPTIPGRDAAEVITPRQPDSAEAPPEPEDEAPEDTATPDTQTDASAPDEEKAPEPDTAEPDLSQQLQRKPLDEAVANILREEASVSAAPAASAIAKPPPTETARPAAATTADTTRQRIALMTAQEGGDRASTQTKPSAGSDTSADEAHLRTVPSINEINATLRARAQANDTSGLTETEKEEAIQRKGFRRGFFLVLIIFAILILPYVFADEIAENLPQTADLMASYVMMVDQIRLSLNELVSGLTG